MLYQRTQYFCHQSVLHPKGIVNCEPFGHLLHTGHFEYSEPNLGLTFGSLEGLVGLRAVSKINTETGDKINVKCFSCCDCIFLSFWFIHFTCTLTALYYLHHTHSLQSFILFHSRIRNTTRQALVHNRKSNRSYLFRNAPAQYHETISVILN